MKLRILLASAICFCFIACKETPPPPPTATATAAPTTKESPPPLPPIPIPTPKELRITAPLNEARVPIQTMVEGTVPDTKAKVWVIIHPILIPQRWVQQSISVNDDGTWRVGVQVGDSHTPSGTRFEIKAFANPKKPLKNGDVLTEWPEAKLISNAVYVTRE